MTEHPSSIQAVPGQPPTRIERDPLGELAIPADAYYGVQTARAIRNFPISGRRPDIALVRAAVQVKKAAARANHATGRLPDHLAGAIVRAADEILGLAPDSGTPAGQAQQALLIDAFRVDPFQAGAGVSHNMNTNEVLANRAIELPGAQGIGSGRRGDYAVVSPNDHVNMAQSTNDTFPTAMRVATLDRTGEALDAVAQLAEAFAERAVAFDGVLKSGRTHMQDAVPIRLGQEFAAYALTIRRAHGRMLQAAEGPGGAEHRRDRGRHRPQRRAGVHQRRRRAALGADRLSPPDGGAPGPGDPIDGARCWTCRPRCGVSRSTWPRSWRTCC